MNGRTDEDDVLYYSLVIVALGFGWFLSSWSYASLLLMIAGAVVSAIAMWKKRRDAVRVARFGDGTLRLGKFTKIADATSPVPGPDDLNTMWDTARYYGFEFVISCKFSHEGFHRNDGYGTLTECGVLNFKYDDSSHTVSVYARVKSLYGNEELWVQSMPMKEMIQLFRAYYCTVGTVIGSHPDLQIPRIVNNGEYVILQNTRNGDIRLCDSFKEPLGKVTLPEHTNIYAWIAFQKKDLSYIYISLPNMDNAGMMWVGLRIRHISNVIPC